MNLPHPRGNTLDVFIGGHITQSKTLLSFDITSFGFVAMQWNTDIII